MLASTNVMKKYAPLGEKLKKYRQDLGLTAKDIAHVTNTSRSYITRLENGYEKPQFSILSILISHYSLSGREASELLTLAGYPTGGVIVPQEGREVFKIDKSKNPNEIQVNLPNDLKALYSDSMFVHLSPFGLVLDFAQTVGPTNQQQTVVSRIGMSKEHAKAMVEVIQRKLEEKDFTVGKVVAEA